MHPSKPPMRNLALVLIAHEVKLNKPSKDANSGAIQVCNKLRPELAIVLGKAGFRSLLSRSLALASIEMQWLRAVHINADGSFDGLEELQNQLNPADFAEGSLALLDHLLALLIAFIGEILTLQLIRDIWPKISFHELDLGHEGTNEKD